MSGKFKQTKIFLLWILFFSVFVFLSADLGFAKTAIVKKAPVVIVKKQVVKKIVKPVKKVVKKIIPKITATKKIVSKSKNSKATILDSLSPTPKVEAPASTTQPVSNQPAPPSAPVISEIKPTVSLEPVLPPLDEETILKSIVKVRCPTDKAGRRYTGAGFMYKNNLVVTAAHVIMDSSSDTCDIIFPSGRNPNIYLQGKIIDQDGARQRHDESGIDLAFLQLPDIETYPEAKTIFPGYPALSFPVCENPKMLGDKVWHLGYPSNYSGSNYLSKEEGEIVSFADINGIEEQISAETHMAYKSPIWGFTSDESLNHPYIVSRAPSFYGVSGGLVLNATKQCLLGPVRGGTQGGSAGENFSIFLNMGWQKAGEILAAIAK